MRLFLEMSAAVSKGFVMFDRVIRSVLAGVCALMLSGTSADAWFKVRNSTSRTVSIAFMTPIDNACFADVRWWIRGWWNIAPGQEAIVLGGDLEWVEYYVHIADDRGPWGAAGPSVTRCVSPDLAFNICAVCPRPPTTFVRRIFRKIETGEAKNFTINLTH
jgi:uncharacterized membrane protein